MNRKFKSIIGLLTAAVMLFLLAACADGKSSKAKTEKTDQTEEAQKVAEAFLDDLADFNYKDAGEYLDDGKWDKGIDEIGGRDDIVEGTVENAKKSNATMKTLADDYDLDLEGTYEDLYDMYEFEYEIKSAKEKKDRTVEVKFEYTSRKPELDGFSDAMNDVMKENTDALNELEMNGASQEDVMEAAVKVIQEGLDKGLEAAEGGLEEDTVDGVLVLEKKKGDWVIVKKDSEIDGKSIDKALEYILK